MTFAWTGPTQGETVKFRRQIKLMCLEETLQLLHSSQAQDWE